MVLNFYNLKYSILDLGNCYLYLLYKSIGAVVAIIVWLLDLLLLKFVSDLGQVSGFFRVLW